jgi:hypothetical protein
MQQPEQQVNRVVGRPIPKGTSGNPRGRPTAYRYHDTYDALASEFGGADKLTPTQHMLIDQIATLKANPGKRDPVRTANVIGRLIKQLGLDKQPPKQPSPTTPLREYLAGRGGAP